MTDELSINDAGGSGEAVPRRVFFKAGIGLVSACYAGGIGYPVYRYLATPAARSAELAKITEMTIAADKVPAAGSALHFLFGNRPTILIHHQDGKLVCLDAVCTHLGCTVQYQEKDNTIHCPCHGGSYDAATGKNIAGPPPKPLKQYNVETKDGQVRISRA
jgi:cytochrome b6-f complex iron-sulfur subunit